MNFETLQGLVEQWAKDRKIIPNSKPLSQLLKLVSEVGELCDAEGKKSAEGIIDGVGDVLVCLINYCALHGLDLVTCLAFAYEEIKDRKGTLMPDGTFVKD